MMNKIFKLFLATAAVAMTFTATAQMSGKELSKELKDRVEKDCRKDAKQLEKDGWRTAPGALSLEKQLQITRYAMLDKTSEGADVYSTATHIVTAANYSIAKGMGQSRASNELAANLKNEVKEMVENSMANQGVTPQEMEAVDQFLSKSSSTASAKLQGVKTTFEATRDKGGMVEYQVTIVLKKAEAIEQLKAAMEKAMKSENSAALWSKVEGAF
ncbi:MAG: hypothetical protein SNG35_01985 [Rikenellaceae bacterium]